jgi:hypothetical protein
MTAYPDLAMAFGAIEKPVFATQPGGMDRRPKMGSYF